MTEPTEVASIPMAPALARVAGIAPDGRIRCKSISKIPRAGAPWFSRSPPRRSLSCPTSFGARRQRPRRRPLLRVPRPK